jgi:hypothetical protein
MRPISRVSCKNPPPLLAAHGPGLSHEPPGILQQKMLQRKVEDQ